jgi:RND family efflux transporter MFP subunit
MPDKKEIHQQAAHVAHAAPHVAPKGPWYENKRAQMAAKILGVLFAAGFVMWLVFYMPYTATDDARIDSHTIKVANLGASGQLIKVNVKEGDKVTAGEVLAELDHATAEAQLEKATAMANFTATDAKRARAVASQQGMSQQQLDKTQQAANVSAADLKLAQIALDRTYIKSPVDGVVILKSAEEGNILEGNQAAFMVADTEHAWVSANILEKSVRDVKLGQTVYITIDEGGTLTGKITDVRQASASVFSLIPSDNAAGNFTKVEQRIPVKIELDPHPGKDLRVGQSVEIRIKIR